MRVSVSNLQKKIKVDEARIKRDSLRALRLFPSLVRAELGVMLVSPVRMRALNFKYRGADETTDVLSFPLYRSPSEFPRDSDFLIGDIIINPSVAESRRKEAGSTLRAEIGRLLVHGLLHLLGYDHERNEYRARKMRRKEAELLNRILL